jgi:D-3-phosphoglycerate dehydrogenase
LEGLRDYLNVAYRLGLLLAQVDHAPPTACKLSYKGEVCQKDTGLLSAAFAAGLMEHAMESEVNIVNAGMLLKERGIELVEERTSGASEFSSVIAAEVVSPQRTATASGTLFGNNMPRLVQKGGYRLESSLDGILLFFVHRDMPGVIGKVGGVFGKHQVNIGHMSVGRGSNEPGGEAIGVLSLDSHPPAEAISAILALDSVDRVWIVHLPPAGEMPAWMGG